MSVELLKLQKLLNSDGSEFFKLISDHINIQIPIVLQKILTINDLANAGICSTINDNTILEAELFIRNVFDKDMIPETEKMEDYLGLFHKSQQKFQFTTGQKHLINIIRDNCVVLSEQANDDTTTTTSRKGPRLDSLFDNLSRWIRNQEHLRHVGFPKFFLISKL